LWKKQKQRQYHQQGKLRNDQDECVRSLLGWLTKSADDNSPALSRPVQSYPGLSIMDSTIP
jgi:hypothetical protein